jgi:transcriptional regulator with XRE-family HTH domain
MAKSDTHARYLHAIASYVEAVHINTGWSMKKMGEVAGTSHSTISRAMAGKNKIAFEKLLALETKSRVPIPAELRGAAIAAQEPTNPTPKKDAREVAEDLIEHMSEAERRALLKQLQVKLSKAV